MKYLLLILYLTGSTTLHAQDNIWTLQECINYALENNLNLRRSRLNFEESKIGLKQSKYDLLPNLNANGSYGYNWGRSIDPTSNLFITQRINFTSVNASSGIILFNGGRLTNTVRQNDHLVDAAHYDVEAAKNNLLFEIIALYTNVIFNRELVENVRKQLENTQRQLFRVTKQVAAGALSRAEQLELEAQQATNELNLVDQQNALDLSLLQLKQALQLPASVELEVVVPDELDRNPADEPILEYQPEEIFQQAQQVLPELRSANERIQSAELGVKIAKGNLYPRLNASAGLSSNYSDRISERFIPDGTQRPVLDENDEQVVFPVPYTTATGEQIFQLVYEPGGAYHNFGFTEQLEENLSKFLSFGITIPIFNGLSARSGVQRAIINQERAEINLQETQNIVRQDIERAYNDVLAAGKSYAAARKQVEAREEAFRMTERRFELEAITYIEYQISENQLFQARSDMLRAKYDYIFKMKLLDFYLGNPLDF